MNNETKTRRTSDSIEALELLTIGMSSRQKVLDAIEDLQELQERRKADSSEPVAWDVKGILCHTKEEASLYVGEPEPLYTAPPVPVVPTFDEWLGVRRYKPLGWVKDAMRESYDACRAAMLQGKAEPVSNRDELPLDYLQGHKDGLEWAAQQAEANHPQTGDWLYDEPTELAKAIRKGPDMPPAQQPVAIPDELEIVPETWKTPDVVFGWNACRDAMLQGKAEQPQNSQQNIPKNIPKGYALVPIEPTESMIIDGFESEPDRFFSDPEEWEAYQKMSGCRQAAHRAKLCWAAMLAAAPKVDKFMSTEFPDSVDLSTICAEAYQVVGVMAEALGVFDNAVVQKVLDNLSQQKLVHSDVLPFSLPAAPKQETQE